MSLRLAADLRYALRGLLARPLFLLVAVASLALGIGVNTAIWSLFHQATLRPLPVPDAAALVNIAATDIKAGSTSNNNAGGREQIFSYAMFRDLEAADHGLDGLAAHRYLEANIAFGEDTRAGTMMLVSGDYFRTLRLLPALGRLISRDDDGAVGEGAVAVLSHAFWRNDLGGDAGVIGRTVLVNGRPLEVIGVAPPGFAGTTFGTRPLVFVPLAQRWALDSQARPDPTVRLSYWLYLFGRVPDGVTREQAQAAINAVYQPVLREVDTPAFAAVSDTRVEEFRNGAITLLDGTRGQSSASLRAGQPLLMLLGTSALVLVIACLNIANLLLARGTARAGEFAVRASIGASRRRLLGQWVAEAVLIGALGALASLPLASATLRALVAVLPVSGAAAFSLSLDPAALQFTALVALGTVLLFGVFPALQLARTQPIQVLRGESGQAGAGRAASRFRAALAVTQIAFSMAALVLAGLFTQSLANLRAVDLGLQVDTLATFTIAPLRNGYTPERAADLIARVEDELAALPGVERASASLVPLLANSNWGSNFSVAGMGDLADDHSYYNYVGTGFFDAIGLPLLAGRAFERNDGASAPKVAIVNRAFLAQFGLPESAVGTRMAMGGTDELDTEIVGIVPDAAYSRVQDGRPGQVYLPWAQQRIDDEMHLYVRSALPPSQLLPQLRDVVKRLDPNLPVVNLVTVPDVLDQSLGAERFTGTLSAALATLATVLAALGLYGVLSYTLAQRKRELGLRLALGAAPARLRDMVLRQVARMTAAGAVLGLVAALALGRLAQSQLFGLQGHDPGVIAIAAGLLALVAFVAGYGPARRAARIDPMTALRHE